MLLASAAPCPTTSTLSDYFCESDYVLPPKIVLILEKMLFLKLAIENPSSFLASPPSGYCYSIFLTAASVLVLLAKL